MTRSPSSKTKLNYNPVPNEFEEELMHTYTQVLEASTEYFDGDDFAAKVFVDKYALQNQQGEFLELTPTDMHHRLAKEFARIEAKYPNPMTEEEIFALLDRFKYICPQGSPMFGIGNPYYVQSLGNCYVIESPYDSYGGILKADQEMAQLMKRRAGVGTDVANIRPKGMPTKNAAKTTDGIAIFMDRFSNTCREVAQAGRRGALMLSNSVKHPEIETFINIKQDSKRVTGANISVRIPNDFMNAVKSDGDFTLQWPVDSNTPVVNKMVKAKTIWDQIVKSAWKSAEPGVLFWDHIIDNSPADIYAEKYPNFKTQSTNPCFSGNTLIAVADGRNAVSIKQLAEENKDVPVYSVDKVSGKVSIKMARHPRITGYDKKLVRVLLDDGSYFDVTPDHKCLLLDGTTVLAKDLNYGNSLPRFTKNLEPVKTGGNDYYRIYGNVRDASKDKTFEHRLIAKFYNQEEWDFIYNQAKKNGFAQTGGPVVHHKDYNPLNNTPDNLQIMTFRDHAELHGNIDQAGENNSRYCGFTSQEIREKALNFTQKLGHRFSIKEWVDFAKKNNLPVGFSEFRIQELGSIVVLSKWCAAECNMEYIDVDPRLIKTYQKMLEQGYEARIYNSNVLVIRKCEGCSKQFEIPFAQREQSFCSTFCSNSFVLNRDPEIKSRRLVGRNAVLAKQMAMIKTEQAKIYSELQFKLGRKPMMEEWEQSCKNNKLPYRIGKSLKFAYHNFKEVIEAGENYNHKVISVVELEEKHTVYNLTVDDNHTVAIITGTREKQGNKYYTGIYTLNCGELPLGLDSCRLLVINLLSFVINPFTKKAKFDYDLYSSVCQKAQRLMDDLVDLEIEKIELLIEKIKSDPEPAVVKTVELNLWNQFLQSCKMGRRTGTGITALGDCLAALGIKYGSKQSIETTDEIYRQLMINAYKSSSIMAGERGSFTIFDASMEKGHPFISHALSQDKELSALYKKHGRRNIALLTTAPTGSVSTQTQTTSGIEPAYLLEYKRRKKINPSDKNASIDFVDPMGDKWQEFTVYHHGVKQWMKATGETDITKSPYHGATSNDIDWVASVDLQAAAQKHIDHSISKTCNLPASATEETVSKVYMRAWELGCKGFTVYRDGCRSGVLMSVDKKSESSDVRPPDINASAAPKRPPELPCDIKKVKVQGEQWTIFVGMFKGKPYEIFGGLSKYLDIPNKHKTGKLVKNGKVEGITAYNLIVGEEDDAMTVKDIANVFENKNYGSFTRLLSLSLRHGTPLQYMVEQLSKDKHSDLTSFSRVVSRVLKGYIKDGAAASEKVCPGCKGEGTLIYQEGCLSCKGGVLSDGNSCTWSKCG